MEELQLALTAARVEQKNFGLWLKSWQVGQVLQALVTDKAPSGQMVLRVGGHQITATADIPVQKGAVLMLEVSTLTPTPTLKIINGPQVAASQVDPLSGRLQLLLPQQGGVADPFATLMNSALGANILSLLGVKGDVLERLLKHLNRPVELTDPKQLKEAFRQSGMFLESQLLQMSVLGGQLAPGDMKAELLRLLHRVNRRLDKLRDSHADESELAPLITLQQELEGAVASITLSQLAASQSSDTDKTTWTFDIPIRFKESIESLSLSVTRENRQAELNRESQEWKAYFSVTLPKLGLVEAELFLRGQKVSVVIFSEDPQTSELMGGQLDHLKVGLESRGLDVSVLHSRQGGRKPQDENAMIVNCLDERV